MCHLFLSGGAGDLPALGLEVGPGGGGGGGAREVTLMPAEEYCSRLIQAKNLGLLIQPHWQLCACRASHHSLNAGSRPS